MKNRSEHIYILVLASVLIAIGFPLYLGAVTIVGLWTIEFFRQNDKITATLFRTFAILSLFIYGSICYDRLFSIQESTRGAVANQKIFTLLTAGLFFLLVQMQVGSYLRSRRGEFSHFGVLVLAGLAPLSIHIPQPEVRLAVQVFFCFYLRSLWFLSSEILGSSQQQQKFNLTRGLPPFWNIFYFPIVTTTPEDLEGLRSNQKSGLQLLFFSLLLKTSAEALEAYLGQNLIFRTASSYLSQSQLYPPFVQISFGNINNILFSTSDRWVICLLGFSIHLLDVIASTGAIIGAARCLGYSCFRHVYKPLSSRNFYQFTSRVNHHYVETISKLALIPLAMSIKGKSSSAIKLSVATTVSVFLFGYVYHFFRWPLIVVSDGYSFAGRYGFFMAYFGLLSLLCGISAYLTFQIRSQNIHKILLFLKNLIYFVVYAIVFSLLGSDYFSISAISRIKFVASLFGL